MLLDEMIESLPLYERKSGTFLEILEAEADQFELMEEHLDDIRDQLFIDTATWGLAVYERELNIRPPSGSTLESRRAAIKAKWRSGGKVDRALLEAVASAILGVKVKVEFDGDIIFSFYPSDDDKIKTLDLMWKTIYETKPAHLPMRVESRIGQIIKILQKIYEFDVPYPITNMFQTAPMDGRIARLVFSLRENVYDFRVLYPITNLFYATDNTVSARGGAILYHRQTQAPVKYPRAGTSVVKSRVNVLQTERDGVAMAAETHHNDVPYLETGEAEL